MPTYSYRCTECDDALRHPPGVHRRHAHRVPRVRRRAAQAVQHHRRDLQRLGLLPHRLPRRRRAKADPAAAARRSRSPSALVDIGVRRSGRPARVRRFGSTAASSSASQRRILRGSLSSAPQPPRPRDEEEHMLKGSRSSSSAATSSTSRSRSSSAPRSPRSSTRSCKDLINPLIGADLPAPTASTRVVIGIPTLDGGNGRLQVRCRARSDHHLRRGRARRLLRLRAADEPPEGAPGGQAPRAEPTDEPTSRDRTELLARSATCWPSSAAPSRAGTHAD